MFFAAMERRGRQKCRPYTPSSYVIVKLHLSFAGLVQSYRLINTL
jgi:hypothetical protein